MDLSSNLVPKKKKKKTNYLAWWQRKPTDEPPHKNQINRKKGGKNHIDTIIYFYYFCARWDFTWAWELTELVSKDGNVKSIAILQNGQLHHILKFYPPESWKY